MTVWDFEIELYGGVVEVVVIKKKLLLGFQIKENEKNFKKKTKEDVGFNFFFFFD